MATSTVSGMNRTPRRSRSGWHDLWLRIWNQRLLYLMLLLPFAFFILFRFYL